ncbi:uncharacterized protein LDX57_005351 [Aspergillus melleus]|uniref:uncharacterized protein n=1 Tax=Aspergillus melleus TaxID=138277 RepID=UPI001E8ECC91|nr:uncharacterized protein LDX57_005351 [Aspergillus melleus]KAH8427640.1 hypothetical protein LDX57_005351 [Aspergillus melleus]
MPSKSQTSPPIPTSEALDAGVVKGFFAQLKLLTSTAGFDTILAVHDENTKLRSQLESKDLELAKVKEEMNEQKKKKETALSEMFEINEKEKGGHKATKEQVLSLQKVIVDKDKCILERDKATNELEKQVKKLHLENAEEKEKLANAEQNINTLQQRIQDKESTINKMKSAGSELKEKLNASKKRVKELEDETASLKGSLATTQAQLTKLESFAVGYNETNEDSV